MPRHFLEWVGAVYLSQDKVAIEELVNNEDVHSNNQGRFKLPTRLTAKTYLFRLIYGGTAYSYSVDPNFADVSTSERFWQRVIDATYEKYTGLRDWHSGLIDTVVRTGKLVMPTGREYNYKATTNRRGEKVWPRTTIYNYPVQGLGADIMAIIRVDLLKQIELSGLEILPLVTVHDSVVLDTPKANVDKAVEMCFNVFREFPNRWKALFGCDFNVPLRTEVQIGPNWGNMEEVKENYAN
jgi:DNA polymerase-1